MMMDMKVLRSLSFLGTESLDHQPKAIKKKEGAESSAI